MELMLKDDLINLITSECEAFIWGDIQQTLL